jgi:hypothetical protein
MRAPDTEKRDLSVMLDNEGNMPNPPRAARNAPHRSRRFRILWHLALAVTMAATTLPLMSERSPALEAAVVRGLRELDLGARLEQRCDIEAMSRIAKAKEGYSPDRIVAAATADTKVDGDSIKGAGAAFRSKGKWYGLSFDCKTSADHMDVLSFDYKIGPAIPESKWDDYGLWR